MKSIYLYPFFWMLILVAGLILIPFLCSQRVAGQELVNSSQTAQINDYVNLDALKIKGIGINSKEKRIIQTFGKPVKIKNNEFDNCENAKFLFYPGLLLKLSEIEETKKWKVYGFQVTSSKWQLAAGIKIGDTLKTVKQRIGNQPHEFFKQGITYLSYGFTDGRGTFGEVQFSFRQNKLVEIFWAFNFC